MTTSHDQLHLKQFLLSEQKWRMFHIFADEYSHADFFFLFPVLHSPHPFLLMFPTFLFPFCRSGCDFWIKFFKWPFFLFPQRLASFVQIECAHPPLPHVFGLFSPTRSFFVFRKAYSCLNKLPPSDFPQHFRCFICPFHSPAKPPAANFFSTCVCPCYSHAAFPAFSSPYYKGSLCSTPFFTDAARVSNS